MLLHINKTMTSHIDSHKGYWYFGNSRDKNPYTVMECPQKLVL